MRVVVRRASRQIEHRNAKVVVQHPDQKNRFSQVHLQWVVPAASKSQIVGRGKLVRDSRPEFARRRTFRIRVIRRSIEHRQPHPDHQSGTLRLNPLNDLSNESSSPFKIAAVRAWSSERRQELMTEISVAVFDIDKLESRTLCKSGRGNVRFDQAFDVVVAEHNRVVVRGDAEFRIKYRVVINDSRFELIFAVWSAESSGMRQLQSCQQVIHCRATEALGMSTCQRVQQIAHRGSIFGAVEQLIRIGSSICLYRKGFTAPDKFATGQAEVLPASDCQVTRSSVGSCVPAFHWMHAPAVSHGEAADGDRVGQRRALSCRKWFVIQWQVDLQVRQVLSEFIDGFQCSDSLPVHCRFSFSVVDSARTSPGTRGASKARSISRNTVNVAVTPHRPAETHQ